MDKEGETEIVLLTKHSYVLGPFQTSISPGSVDSLFLKDQREEN